MKKPQSQKKVNPYHGRPSWWTAWLDRFLFVLGVLKILDLFEALIDLRRSNVLVPIFLGVMILIGPFLIGQVFDFNTTAEKILLISPVFTFCFGVVGLMFYFDGVNGSGLNITILKMWFTVCFLVLAGVGGGLALWWAI